jgi:serine/threonine-protein phosphatase CPPED1
MIKNIISAMIFLWLFVGCVPTKNPKEKIASGPYKIVVGADPQLFRNQKDDRFWQQTVDEVIALDPDFFIVCGDLTNAGNKASRWDDPVRAESYEKQATDYLAGSARLEKHLPVYNVAGNHDVTLRPTPERLAWYESKFGKAWYSFEHKNSLYIVIESNLLRDPGGAPEKAKEQKEWLADVLLKSKDKKYDHKFAFMHHPLCLKSVDEKSGYYNMPIAVRNELLGLFNEYAFTAIFSGHLHKNNVMNVGELELITTNSCCTPAGKEPKGIRIVNVLKDSIKHQYVSLEELAKKRKDESK